MVIITHEEGLIKIMFHMVWIRMVSIRRVKIITIVVGDFVSIVVVVDIISKRRSCISKEEKIKDDNGSLLVSC